MQREDREGLLSGNRCCPAGTLPRGRGSTAISKSDQFKGGS